MGTAHDEQVDAEIAENRPGMISAVEVLEAARSGNTEADDLETMAAEALSAYPPGSARRIGDGPTNDDRARWAGDAAELFAAFTSQEIERDGRWEVAGDLICNLMHWLDREPEIERDEHSEAVLDRAREHYRAEREPERPSLYLEDLGPRFAELIERAAGEHGAGVFAADLAAGGAKAEHVEIMAHRWKNGDFEPADFADELLAFGHELRDVETETAATS